MATLAVFAAVVATLDLISPLPTALRAPEALLFILVGPGCAIMIWVKDVSGALRCALVPVLSLAVVLLVSYLAVLEGLWHPGAQLLLLVAATLVSVALKRHVRVSALAPAPAGQLNGMRS